MANQTPQEIAERLGKSLDWASEHSGYHVCVDRRHYVWSCIVADPECDSTARYFMRKYPTS
jgi:hypothetical protein